MSPKLSVVVPYFNVEDYIGDCLESLRLQTLGDLEVICVDDGSQDGSAAIARAFASEDPRFTVVQQENQGLGPARNTGAGHAEGKYLAFVDSDDIVAPRAYSRLINSLETTNSDLAAGNTFRFTRKGYVTQSYAHREAFQSSRRATTLAEHPALAGDRMIWNKVYRREFWESNDFQFPAIRYEDYPVTLSAYLQANSVDVLKDAVYFWRIRKSGTSITQQALQIDNLRDRFASDMLVLKALSNEDPDSMLDAASRVYAQLVDVDLMTFAEAIIADDAASADSAWVMAQELATALPSIERPSGRLYFADHLQEALRSGNRTQTEILARWRTSRSVPRLLGSILKHPSGPTLNLLGTHTLSRVKGTAVKTNRRLRVHLDGIEEADGGLVITARPQLHQRLQGIAGVKMLLHGRDKAIEIPTTWKIGTDGNLRITGTISYQLTELAPQGDASFGISIALSAGPIRWRGQILLGDKDLPGAVRVSENLYMQAVSSYVPSAFGDCLRLGLLQNPTIIDSVDRGEDGITLNLRGVEEGWLTIHQPFPTPDTVVDIEGGRACLTWEDLTVSPMFDNPVTARGERHLTVRDPLGVRNWLTLGTNRATVVRDDLECAVATDRNGRAILQLREIFDLSHDVATETILRPAPFLPRSPVRPT